MLDNYLKAITLVEKIHRQSLNDLKFDLNKIEVHDINNVQSFILYNISDRKLCIGEITNMGCYMGSNVSYNLRKLVENGYVLQEPNVYDRRSANVCLTEKGLKFYEILTKIFENRAKNISEKGVEDQILFQLNDLLSVLEREMTKNQFK